MPEVSNEVLAERIEGLKQIFEKSTETIRTVIVDATQDQNKSLGRIEEQTTKTNGRVTILEKWRIENERFIEMLKADREDNRKRTRDLLWKIAEVIVVGLLAGKTFHLF